MGIVWLARDEQLDRNVALKFLPDLVVHDSALLSDLKREAMHSLELTHRNIVRIYDLVQDSRSACISMEFVDGATLAALRSEKSAAVFSCAELHQWLPELCDALAYAHTYARVVHSDLKPSNLMVNAKGTLKITDFGIARSLSDSVSLVTRERSTTGTLVYMSPQQLEGERASHLDDIYSLGATLYDLLTSKPPFYRGQIDRQIRQRIPPSLQARREELDIDSDEVIPESWEQTIAACLAKDPSERPQSAIEILKSLESPPGVPTEREQPSSEPRSTSFIAPEVPEQPSHNERRPKVIGLGVMCLILAAAAIGLYFLVPKRTPVLTEIGPQGRSPGATPTLMSAEKSPSAAALSVAERLRKEATELRDKGDTTKALARLQDASVQDPKNPNVLAEMAMVYESIQLLDRANETWKKLREIGPAAGALYELAEMKLKSGVTLPTPATTPLDPASKRNDAEGIPDGSTFGITEATTSETPDPEAETKIKLKISVKARPNTEVDHTKVKIQVFFYDTVDSKEIVLTDAHVSYEWLTPKHDWKATNPEVLAVTYLRPKTKSKTQAGGKKYFGYIVRIYYHDQLQAVRADPTRLLNLFPPPFTAPK
jgi:serine/threonine protein kinase